MQITFPYNEILPTGKAHDAFLIREAFSFATAGNEVELLIGKGSYSYPELCTHYGVQPSKHMHTIALPILRKNYGLPFSWNALFFYATRRHLQKHPTDILILSVLKQAADLLRYRHPATTYVYEAHEIAVYPHLPPKPHWELEKWVLSRVDLICVTTHQLKHLLENPPYSLRTRIAVLPLAVEALPLPPPPSTLPPTVTYVGQLYEEQGIELLLDAMALVPEIYLRIIGGRPEERAHLDRKQPNVSFLGYFPPARLPEIVGLTHAFIAPFSLTGRMPYVAHTKLYEYQAWGRCVIAPEAPIVREHFPHAGLLCYQDLPTLVAALRQAVTSPPPPPTLFPWSTRISHYLALLKNQ